MSLTNRIGKRVTFKRPPGPDDVDEYNQPLDKYIPVFTVWGAVEPLRGREYFAAMSEHADVTTRIRIRYRKGVDRTMRAECDGVEHDILHIIHPNFGERELQIMCKERQ